MRGTTLPSSARLPFGQKEQRNPEEEGDKFKFELPSNSMGIGDWGFVRGGQRSVRRVRLSGDVGSFGAEKWSLSSSVNQLNIDRERGMGLVSLVSRISFIRQAFQFDKFWIKEIMIQGDMRVLHSDHKVHQF